MDWSSDYYMQTAQVEAGLPDGRLVLTQEGMRIGAFKSHALVLLESQAADN